MKINEAISVARRFNQLYVQTMRETRKRNPNSKRVSQLKNEAVKVSTRLRRLMGWESN